MDLAQGAGQLTRAAGADGEFAVIARHAADRGDHRGGTAREALHQAPACCVLAPLFDVVALLAHL